MVEEIKLDTYRWAKEEFLVRYVLNRANTTHDALSGEQAAQQALEAWDFIKQVCYESD